MFNNGAQFVGLGPRSVKSAVCCKLFMIFITFESRVITSSKIGKLWLLLIQWVAKSGKISGKMMTILIYLSNN